MKTLGLPLSITLLVAAAAITLACGSSTKPVNNSGSIQSVTVSPAIADAEDFPGDQVQFVATGYYKTPPSPITPLAAMWGVCQNNAATAEVTISSNGLAHCAAGATGKYSVFAGDFPDPSCLAITACGGACMVTGTAQLTCP
jgi:hypothetical protein